MKYSLLFLICSCYSILLFAKNDPKYPNPEFSNEVYLYQTGQPPQLLRLEKGSLE